MDFPHNLWDLSSTSLPQQITNLDESDFLSILSKQLNPAAVTTQPISAQALAQQINQQQGVSPPVSEESSPSPPTSTNRGLAKSTDAAAGAADGNDMQHKRKKIQRDESDESDSDSDQPPSKSQKEQPGKKGKRKSTGDEARAMKRKEQNRAAQRAFRERKEKHVKDLEDQVSALEQKSTAQATENENLRELLGRLQNENLMLKQSAFTFNFNSAQTPRSTTTPTVSNSRATPSTATSPIDKSPSTAPAASPKDSNPQQQTGGPATNVTGYTPLLSFSSLGSSDNLISMGTPPTTTNNSANNSSSPLTFFSPPPTNAVPSPYTTLASNPMYTSYTDFSAWDQFFQSAALDQTLAGVGSDPSLVSQANPSGSSRMEDLLTTTDHFSELIPFSGFSPTSGNNNSAGMMTGLSPSGSGNSPIDHVATSAKAASQQPTGAAFSLESREAASSNRPSLPARSSSPCGGADPDEAPLAGSSHHNPNMTAMNISKANSVPGPMDHDVTQCPKSKEDLGKIIEQQPVGTLGSVAGLPQPQTFSDKKTMRLKEVWNALKSHPRFEEVDMDELCRELSSKVKCDGGMPGLDESDKPCEELSKLIDAVKAKKAEEAKAAQQVKQQQRVIQSISTGGLPENSMNRSPTTASTNTASPNMMSNFSLFGNSPYNSYLPFAMPQSASSTTSQFTMPQSATTTDFGFDSRRPSLGGAHNSSGSNDAASFMSSGSSNVATPQSHGANGSTPIMVDQSNVGLSQSLTGGVTSGATDSWLAGAFEMPSPNTQFLSFLSSSGGFSPNSYLNIPDKE